VAVDDAALVGGLHRPSQLFDELGRSLGGQGPAAELVGQSAALDEFQATVGAAVLPAHLINLHDVGVVQLGDRFGLDLEAGDLFGAGGGAGQDTLEGHDAAQAVLAGLVNDGHAATTEQFQDVIAGDV